MLSAQEGFALLPNSPEVSAVNLVLDFFKDNLHAVCRAIIYGCFAASVQINYALIKVESLKRLHLVDDLFFFKSSNTGYSFASL